MSPEADLTGRPGVSDLVEILVAGGMPRVDAEAFVYTATDLLSGQTPAAVVAMTPYRALTATRRYLAWWLDQQAQDAPRRGEWGW